MSDAPLNLDQADFLARHWQREPLLIRGALPDFKPPLDADELAGLALEPAVESRIIEHREGRWNLHHGPFTERDFQRNAPWTLLVQAVDHWVPEVAALRRLVDFIPQWRVDDVMVSYAVDGGSVGPHYDNYDVFLLQGQGQREWHTGDHCGGDTPLLEHPDLRILRDFESRQSHILNPGDILYLPPGIAHWGIARGECTTFSIGFRAPRVADMVSRWADQLLEQMDVEQFLADRGRAPVERPGEIAQVDLEDARRRLRSALDSAIDDRWFGELVTEPRYPPEPADAGLAQARAALANRPRRVALVASAKLAWQKTETGVIVYANGASLACSKAVLATAMTLCRDWSLEGNSLSAALACPDSSALLDALLEADCVHVE